MLGLTRWAARYDDWRQPRPHPVTGDMLKAGERVTWLIMGVYRRWSVFLALQALTLAWWIWPWFFPGGLFGWNLVWSDLAVVVEMMVGISFIGQSLRDAVVIRTALRDIDEDGPLLREELAIVRENLEHLRADARLIRDIHEALAPGGDVSVVAQPNRGGRVTLELRPDGGGL